MHKRRTVNRDSQGSMVLLRGLGWFAASPVPQALYSDAGTETSSSPALQHNSLTILKEAAFEENSLEVNFSALAFSSVKTSVSKSLWQ